MDLVVNIPICLLKSLDVLLDPYKALQICENATSFFFFASGPSVLHLVVMVLMTTDSCVCIACRGIS